MNKLGTNYGGWYIPNELELDENSIIYSAGAGEDISFDLKLQMLTDCHLIMIDPTERAKIHYNEVL